MNKLRLDIWSDIVCPWCYIGKRHLEQALAQFEHRDSVEIVWRSFELDPDAPAVRDASTSYAEHLARKYRVSSAQGQQMIDRVKDAGKRAGLDFDYDHIKSGNTFGAHRLLHWAKQQGKQDELKERFMRAYMTEGQAIGERDVLIKLAGEVGLDVAEARAILDDDRFAGEVRADEKLANELEIRGVPFFVMAGRVGVSGAQPAEVLRRALDQAWREHASSQVATFAEGAACGPEGCDPVGARAGGSRES